MEKKQLKNKLYVAAEKALFFNWNVKNPNIFACTVAIVIEALQTHVSE